MSINKQKNFLFLLFLLINKFIFISGGLELVKNVTSNETIIGIGDILDNVIGDENDEEEEQVNDTNEEEEQVNDTNGEEEQVSDTNGEEEQVSDTNGEEEQVSDTNGEEEQASDTNDEKAEISDTNGEEEQASDTNDEKTQVSDTNNEKAESSDTNNEKAQVSDTNNEENVVNSDDTNTKGNTDIKLENYQSCEDIQPTNGIIEDCTSYSYNNEQSCCYVSINYKYNEFNICIKIRKDKKTIERRIEQLENNYEGCDSVDIDCHSEFINISFIFLLFVLFL